MIALVLSLGLMGVQAGAQVDSLRLTDTARLLAGMTPAGDPAMMQLAGLRSWQKHASTFDAWWNTRTQPQIDKVAAWAAYELGAQGQSRAPAYYFFSGPDFLYVSALYPHAATYILCGKEPVGVLPDLIALTNSPDLDAVLGSFQSTFKTILNFSFFITEDMKKDLRNSQLQGVLPVLLVFLARREQTIVSVTPVQLDKAGVLSGRSTFGGEGGNVGVRIVFTSSSTAPVQTLYYFSTDLSNSGIRANPGFIHFCERFGMGNSFVKSASYLMHLGEFSQARDFLLKYSDILVQDDSGIPFKYFSPETWSVRVFGNYVGPIEIFQKYYQQDLAQRYAVSNPKPLDFGMGYRFNPSESTIMVAFRKGASGTQSPSIPASVPAAQ